MGEFGVYYNFAGKLGEGGYTVSKDKSGSGIDGPKPVDPNSVRYSRNPETFISGSRSLIYRMWYDIFTGESNVLLGGTLEYRSAFSRRFGKGATLIGNPLTYVSASVLTVIVATAIQSLGKEAVTTATGWEILKFGLSGGIFGSTASRAAMEAATDAATKQAATQSALGSALSNVLFWFNVVSWIWLAINLFELWMGN